MTTTLTSLTTRVQTALMDTGAQVWDAPTITEGIRLALGEYSLAGDAAVTLSGLDGAAVTTLPGLHDTLIVWGAAAYAALSRTIDRAESHQLGGDAAPLKTWGDARLREYKGMLGFVFPGYLVTLAGTGGSAASEDPAKLAAEVTLLGAQAALGEAQAAQAEAQAALGEAQTVAVTGQEARAASAAELAAALRVSEALRAGDTTPWGQWADGKDIAYPKDYDRS
jgi:hypothetical protein